MHLPAWELKPIKWVKVVKKTALEVCGQVLEGLHSTWSYKWSVVLMNELACIHKCTYLFLNGELLIS
jgi:hypothetical protein